MLQEVKSLVSTQTKTKSILGIVLVQYPQAELSSSIIHLLTDSHTPGNASSYQSPFIENFVSKFYVE